MRNTVNASEFNTAIAKVKKGLAKNPSFKSLGQVKVEFKNGECILIATNLEQYVISKIPSYGEHDFSFVFKNTESVIKASKYFDKDLNFVFNDGVLTLASNNKSLKQNTIDLDLFPEIPIIEISSIYKYNAKDLLDRYNKVKYAVSRDKIRPAMAGVCFRDNKMIASDSFRMAVNTDDLLKVDREFIVPNEAMNLLDMFNKKTSIELQVNHRHLIVTDGNTSVITRLIDGEFFDIDRIIPKNTTETYGIDSKRYTKELKYLKDISKDSLNIKFEKGKLTKADEHGEYTVCVGFAEDSDIIYGFNGNYMLDALGQFKNVENVDYNIINNLSPITITHGNDLALVLPVRLA